MEALSIDSFEMMVDAVARYSNPELVAVAEASRVTGRRRGVGKKEATTTMRVGRTAGAAVRTSVWLHRYMSPIVA